MEAKAEGRKLLRNRIATKAEQTRAKFRELLDKTNKGNPQLETGPRGTIHVIQSMDEAIETLFPFYEFYNAGRELFLLATHGKLPAAFDLRRFAEQARSETESW